MDISETKHLNNLFSILFDLDWVEEKGYNHDRFVAGYGEFRFRLEKSGRGDISLYLEEKFSAYGKERWTIKSGKEGGMVVWYGDMVDAGTRMLLGQIFEKANRRRSGFMAIEALKLMGITELKQ